MRALIFTGGECVADSLKQWLRELDIKESLIIAADSGYDTARRLGVVPQLIIGDMDSVENDLPHDVETIRALPEKDETDTMLALNAAFERGADDILIIGGAGGRADHWLSNIFMLEYLLDHGVRAAIWDGTNRICVLKNGTVRISPACRYFGIVALEDSVVTATGCRYPMDKAILRRTEPYAVSNEVICDETYVTADGCVIIAESY